MSKWTVAVMEGINNDIYPILNDFAFEDPSLFIRFGYRLTDVIDVAVIMTRNQPIEDVFEIVDNDKIAGYVAYEGEAESPYALSVQCALRYLEDIENMPEIDENSSNE